jgi:hypothetical protein
VFTTHSLCKRHGYSLCDSHGASVKRIILSHAIGDFQPETAHHFAFILNNCLSANTESQNGTAPALVNGRANAYPIVNINREDKEAMYRHVRMTGIHKACEFQYNCLDDDGQVVRVSTHSHSHWLWLAHSHRLALPRTLTLLPSVTARGSNERVQRAYECGIRSHGSSGKSAGSWSNVQAMLFGKAKTHLSPCRHNNW